MVSVYEWNIYNSSCVSLDLIDWWLIVCCWDSHTWSRFSYPYKEPLNLCWLVGDFSDKAPTLQKVLDYAILTRYQGLHCNGSLPWPTVPVMNVCFSIKQLLTGVGANQGILTWVWCFRTINPCPSLVTQSCPLPFCAMQHANVSTIHVHTYPDWVDGYISLLLSCLRELTLQAYRNVFLFFYSTFRNSFISEKCFNIFYCYVLE